MNLAEQLESVELKVRELAYRLERFKKENALLREENKRLRSDLSSLQHAQLPQEQGPSHQTPDGELTPGEAGENVFPDTLNDQLAHYISEIDKCIEWLDNHG